MVTAVTVVIITIIVVCHHYQELHSLVGRIC